MANNNVTPLLFTLVFFFVISTGIVRLAKGQTPLQAPFEALGENKRWCVAKPSASDEELQNNIDFVCDVLNCDMIKPGGSCAEPDNHISRASVAMNLYYQQEGRNSWNCDFKKSGLISVVDPSYGDCKYDG